jgi:hypothetical protein
MKGHIMATGNTLHILNHFDYPVTIYVSDNNFNCCDAPLQNQPVGHVAPNGSVSLAYRRKDGHGCNGEQGQFELAINISMLVDLNFDSDGGMANPSSTSGCAAAVSQNGDGTYTLIVYAN